MHAVVEVVDGIYKYQGTWKGAGNYDYYMTAKKRVIVDGMSVTLLLDVKATILSFLLISHIWNGRESQYADIFFSQGK